jgi:uncharacterized membrane protein
MKIKQRDIQIISQNSNWSKEGVEQTLVKDVYPDAQQWKKFLHILFLSLGAGFTLAGIIFFFAYNWGDLHKFVKIGMIEGLIIITTAAILFTKFKPLVKNILLTSAAVLVGVLFAVFGQVYQTGANAYDFFLGWTVFIALWGFISNFPPLWVLFLTLVNTTLIFYADQVAFDWSFDFYYAILFYFNTLVLISFTLLNQRFQSICFPKWFSNLLGLAAIYFATIGISWGIHNPITTNFIAFLMIVITSYTVVVFIALSKHNLFYLASIAFSSVIMIVSLFTKIENHYLMFLLATFFVIGSLSAIIYQLVQLNKKWEDE